MFWFLLASPFVLVHGVDRQPIELHVDGVVSLREVRKDAKEHFAKGTNCLVFMTDGKYIGAVETCKEIDRLISENKK